MAIPQNWRFAYAYDQRSVRCTTANPPPPEFSAATVKIVSDQVQGGIQTTLGNIRPDINEFDRDKDLQISVDVHVDKGQLGLQVCRDDQGGNGGTSVFISNPAYPENTGVGMWLKTEPGELMRLWYKAAGNTMLEERYFIGIQRSWDDGSTWEPRNAHIVSARDGMARFCFGGFYDNQIMSLLTFNIKDLYHFEPGENRRGMHEVSDGRIMSMSVIKFRNDLKCTLISDSDIPVIKNMYVYNEGRAIEHSSGLWIQPLQTGPRNADPYNDRLNTQMLIWDKVAQNWRLIDGHPSTYPRGMVEPSGVELSNKDVLFIGNSICGELLTMLWKYDQANNTFRPEAETKSHIQAARSKHDVLKLSDDTIAMVYAALKPNTPDGMQPRCVLALAFSDDDCKTWKDYHMVHQILDEDINHALQEAYLAEVNGQLRIDYMRADVGGQLFRTMTISEAGKYRRLSNDSAIGPSPGKVTLTRVVPRRLVDRNVWLKIVAEQVAGPANALTTVAYVDMDTVRIAPTA